MSNKERGEDYPSGIYRPFQFSDAEAIAHYYNKNLERTQKMWCGKGNKYSAWKIQAHLLTLSLRGKAVTQVHEEDGEFISYYGGYEQGDTVTYTIGVINLDLDNPMQQWRIDSAKSFQRDMQRGMKTFRLKLSSDDAAIVAWMENDVGMERMDNTTIWTINQEKITQYISKYLEE